MTKTTNLPKPSSNETKLAYQQKVRSEFDKLTAQINELQAKADQAKADAAVEYNSIIQELYAKRDAAELKLQELQQAGEEAWQEVQTGFEKAWKELDQSLASALNKFR